MAILPIRMYPDPVLRERAPEVGKIDDAIHKLVKDMEDTMRDAPGIGLAAPQVGVQRRVIVYDAGEETEGFHALVNPAIVSSTGSESDDEGCLSIPGITYPVERATLLTVTGLDLSGQTVTYDAEGLHARVLQHEIDHLDGVLFIDRIERELRKEAMRTIRERALGDGPAPQRERAARL